MAGEGADFITGEEGDDWLAGGGGRNTIEGGSGEDIFELSEGKSIVTDFELGKDQIAIPSKNVSQVVIKESRKGLVVQVSRRENIILQQVAYQDFVDSMYNYGVFMQIVTDERSLIFSGLQA